MHGEHLSAVEEGAGLSSNESIPLINAQTNVTLDGNPASATSSDHSICTTATEAAIDQIIETEKNEPWPHTFERSISLLAGPHLNIDDRDLDLMTRSPLRPTPQMTRRWRRAKPKGADKSGYFSPEMSRVESHGLIPPKHFSSGLKKMASLDGVEYNNGRQAQITAQLMNDRKDHDAKAYRQKLLAQKSGSPSGRKNNADHHDSPGYGKELEVDQAQKHAKQKQKSVNGKATFYQSLFNMCNVLMGVGILGLPYVFREAGWIGGLVVMLLFSLITWRTSILIGRELNGDPRPCGFFDDSPFKSPTPPGSAALKARMLPPITSFPEIARNSFGSFGAIVLSSVLYFELFSSLAIFFVSLGDHMHALVPRLSTANHQVIMAFFLVIPTAFLRTPKHLSYLSMVGTFATISVVSAVFVAFFILGDISNETSLRKFGVEEPPYRVQLNILGLPSALGLVAFSFAGHAILPSIYSSMKKPQEFEQLINYSFFIVTCCCLLVAVSGYYMFGNTVDDQITISLANANIPHAGTALTIIMWLMVLTTFSKFTLDMFPLALGIEEIAEPFLVGETTKEIASNVIRYGLIIASLMVAIFLPSFSLLCSLVGLICTMVVSVIFPAGAHLKMFGSKLSIFEKIIDVAFVTFGCISSVVGTMATLKEI